ncbi:hypothetical protein J1N35_004448 [Gossypium stocksii]|uniref:Uncharacterized protein n=1 Tax=Gossypium stocksii TaxID=47602 RepID=A0A9D3WCQ7_9ROSI|nr:hypothetical protein J1N35_004448 [Gossypium stocksii]
MCVKLGKRPKLKEILDFLESLKDKSSLYELERKKKVALEGNVLERQLQFSHEPYTLDHVTTIILDAESRLHDPLRLPLSINTAQVIAPIPKILSLPPRLRPNTSGPSAFPGQTQYSGHFPTSHFVLRPRSSYGNRGKGKTTSRL